MEFRDKFVEWFKGDAGAVEFAEHLWEAAQKWDDIEDEGGCDSANSLLAWLAFGKEYTPFFAVNSHLLRPAMLTMYLQWTAANTLEHGDRNDVNKAYMLRASLYTVFHVMAWITGGEKWAVEVGPDIYRTYGETADELWKEFNHA